MHIPLPYGLIAIFITFCIFYYTNQKHRIRKEQRRERLEEKQEELLQTLRNRTNKEQGVEGSDTTNA